MVVATDIHGHNVLLQSSKRLSRHLPTTERVDTYWRFCSPYSSPVASCLGLHLSVARPSSRFNAFMPRILNNTLCRPNLPLLQENYCFQSLTTRPRCPETEFSGLVRSLVSESRMISANVQLNRRSSNFNHSRCLLRTPDNRIHQRVRRRFHIHSHKRRLRHERSIIEIQRPVQIIQRIIKSRRRRLRRR